VYDGKMNDGMMSFIISFLDKSAFQKLADKRT
jgi:hypothetical protein